MGVVGSNINIIRPNRGSNPSPANFKPKYHLLRALPERVPYPTPTKFVRWTIRVYYATGNEKVGWFAPTSTKKEKVFVEKKGVADDLT